MKNKLIKNYNSAIKALYDHVGFVEDYIVYPIYDLTDKFWSIDNQYEIKYANSLEQYDSNGDFYISNVYAQRFYNKWIYIGKDLTMVFMDTHTDGMRYFAVFTNALEVK